MTASYCTTALRHRSWICHFNPPAIDMNRQDQTAGEVSREDNKGFPTSLTEKGTAKTMNTSNSINMD